MALQAHVIPRDDLIEHERTPDCVCGPSVLLINRRTGQPWILTHHSLDGREHTHPDND